MNLSFVLDALSLKQEQTLCCYLVGSRLFGTATEQSDYDFVIIMKDNAILSHLEQCDNIVERYVDTTTMLGRIDANVVTASEFQYLLHEYNIKFLLCLFIPESHRWLELQQFQFNNDKQYFTDDDLYKLRVSVNTTANKAKHYAKKLYTLEKDVYKCKKNLVHAWRYTHFGIQLVKHGCIQDYSCADEFYYEIMNINTDEMEWKDVITQCNPKLKSIYQDFIVLLPHKKKKMI